MNMYDPGDMMLLAGRLRVSSTVALQYLDLPGMESLLGNLHHVVSVLQHHKDEFDNFLFESTASGDMGRPATRAYNITFLINCFWATGLLRHDNDLREALVLGASISLPPRLAAICRRYLELGGETQMQLPSKTTMSRMRGRIDVAWMMMTRDTLRDLLRSSGFAIYVQVDASPQGGAETTR